MRLRHRLAVAGAVALAVLGLAGYLMVESVWSAQVAQIDEQLTGAAPVAALAVDPGPLACRSTRVGSTAVVAVPDMSRLENGLNTFYVAVLSGEGRTVILAPNVAAGQAPMTPASGPRPATSPRPTTVGSASGQGRWRAILVAGMGHRKVLVAESLSRAAATTGRIRSAMLAVGALVLVVLGAAGYWIERLGLRPIAHVAQVAAAIAAGERARRVKAPGSYRSEAGHLARALNVMLDEQQASQERLEQFVADASHELRTPVSAIQGLAELWSQQHRSGRADPDETMRRIGQEGRRMAALVENLLLLARLGERATLRPGRVDLTALARAAERDASARHPARDFRCQARGSVVVSGEETMLRQVVANLVENAFVHTPPSAAVSLRVDQAGGTAIVEVSDTGPGMTVRDSERAFDRFWRADGSRSRPGSGLGLPIVAAIVAAHQGKITLRTSPDGGTTVRVELPTVGAAGRPAVDPRARRGAGVEPADQVRAPATRAPR